MKDFILISLAVWRISSLLAQENAPGDILKKLRIKLASLDGKFWQNVSNGVHCVWCNSIWVAMIGALPLSKTILEWIINVLALSAISIIINSFVMKGD
jgi:hypothetical protein